MKFPKLSEFIHADNDTNRESYQSRVKEVMGAKCNHSETMEYRVKYCVNGSTQVRQQCAKCGYISPQAVSKASAPPLTALSELDNEAEKRYIDDARMSMDRIYLDEKSKRRSEWFKIYDTYLTSAEWKARRALVLKRDGNQCQGCLSATATQVHHLTYDNVGEELLFQLTSLCGPCHERIHEKEAE